LLRQHLACRKRPRTATTGTVTVEGGGAAGNGLVFFPALTLTTAQLAALP
jgi:hypothetical protein